MVATRSTDREAVGIVINQGAWRVPTPKQENRPVVKLPIAGSSSNEAGRVLLVDDEEAIRRICEVALRRVGFQVDTAAEGRAAIGLLQQHRYHVVVSDIGMPGLDGLQLLREVRGHDLDVPVVLMTGNPDVETAVRAIELGALRYLIKPFLPKDMVQTVRSAVQLRRLAALKREALGLLGDTNQLIGDRVGLEACFARALGSLQVASQPIVSYKARAAVAYEVLMRPQEPLLPNPGAVLSAAERLGRIHEVGRAVRACAMAEAGEAPRHVELFINLHPNDLLDEQLYDPESALAAMASRVVLELTERASLSDISDVKGRVTRLRGMGFRLALDDLGAGYAGLNTFARLEPEVAKIDMALVRNIDASPTQRTLVRNLVILCRELGIDIIAEGIETTAERDVLVDLGVDLLQGYFFAKPGRGFPTPCFAD